RLVDRVAEDAGRDRRKRDRRDSVLLGQMQRAAIARGEQSLGGLVAAVDGTEAVNNVAIWKIMCTGDHRLTRADRCQRPALRLKARSGRSMDCSGHAAAGAQ